MRLHVLPALHGDALWLEYGEDHRAVLVDGGPRSASTTTLVRQLLDSVDLELVVISHIDADHITGILDVFADRRQHLNTRDVWFNAWKHLPTDVLGVKQAEQLSDAISSRRLPWNKAFDEGPVMVPDDGPLPRVPLAGGLELTLLSPTRQDLAVLRPVWKRDVEQAGLVKSRPAEPAKAPDSLGAQPLDFAELATRPFRSDQSVANGASIAVLAEDKASSVLLTGDAHADVLEAQLRRLARDRGVDAIQVDAVKLSHHGSRYNLSTGLLSIIDCHRWILSTNGAVFGHPDPETIARLVVDRPGTELVFNYRSESTERFALPRLTRAFGYRTIYPKRGAGISIEI